MSQAQTTFYVTGGTLQCGALCYVERQADRALYEGIKQGEFCYVLTSRQMGKSSLMVRTAEKLRRENMNVAVLDLTAVGQNLSAEQWYDGLLGHVGRQLNLENELEDFWVANSRLGPLVRFMRALREVVLPRRAGQVVIFVDEIDAVRSLPFSTDEFFAAIRECCNRRSEDAEYRRLTFCLLGVATPSDLIRDTRTTPFNVGRRIELRDFTEAEAAPLAGGLGRDGPLAAKLLQRILYWTAGHPYLTQRLCQAAAQDAKVTSPAGVDRLCDELFLSHRARERDDNLLFVRERLLRSDVDRAGLLDLYDQMRRRRKVRDEETSNFAGILRLSGIARVTNGCMGVRNRIYHQVFDRDWVEANMPDAEKRRQRRAYRRGQLRASLIGLSIFVAVLSVVGVEYYRVDKAHRDTEDALLQTNKARQERIDALIDALRTADAASVPIILENLQPDREEILPRLRDMQRQTDLPAKHRARLALLLVSTDPTLVPFLKDAMLHADPQELLLFRHALRPHRAELTEELWQTTEDPGAAEETRLRAACVLADFDPGSPRWDRTGAELSGVLVSQNPAALSGWLEALRPVRRRLVAPLVGFFHKSEKPDESYVAASILAEFAADQPEVLVELIEEADPRTFAVLLTKFEFREAAATLLGKTLAPDWKDRPLDPTWTVPAAETVRKIEAADGILAERFAFCQTLKLEQFAGLAVELRTSGYRPVRLRPYAVGKELLAAVLWQRDGRDWLMDHALSASELRMKDGRTPGYAPVDVAGYRAPRDLASEKYAALWVKTNAKDGEFKLNVGLSESEHAASTKDISDLSKINMFRPVALQVIEGESGKIFSSIWWKSEKIERVRAIWGFYQHGYETQLTPSDLQMDVCLTRAPAPPARVSSSIPGWNPKALQLQGQPEAVLSAFRPLIRGINHFSRGDDQEAVTELSSYIDKLSVFAFVGHDVRAMAYARLGFVDKARKDLDMARGNSKDLGLSATKEEFARLHAYAEAFVLVFADQSEDGLKRFEAFLADHPQDEKSLFLASRLYALAAGRARKSPPAPDSRKRPGQEAEQTSKVASPSAADYPKRALDLLEKALAAGFLNDQWELEKDPALDALRADARFRTLLNKMALKRRYCAVWSRNAADFEGDECHGLSPQAHLRRCRELLASGYRPAALTALCDEENGLAVVTASVWHRPIIPNSLKDALARRRANAALLLARFGDLDKVWSLLKTGPDPLVRTSLIHSFDSMGVKTRTVLQKFRQEGDPSIRQAVILSLADHPHDAANAAKKSLVSQFLQLYATDPDPGVHAALDWLLRRWGHGGDVQRLDDKMRARQPHDQRLWYVNGQGQTLAVVPGPVEFPMGSPGQETGRDETEVLHPKRLGRTFAVAAKDVTVEQFLRFQPRHSFRKQYSPDLGGPMVDVTWYQAARYCRWLSEQEGIPEDQMCFPALDEIKPGMVLPRDYLTRTGYRLPTESEWEFACRAGTTTARFFGNDLRWLSNYCWHLENSHNHAWPVGQLKPNDFGLFDMYGNVGQWCMDPYKPYVELPAGRVIDDWPTVGPSDRFVVRGGSFITPAANVRSAKRYSSLPGSFFDVGFRVARTLATRNDRVGQQPSKK